jgi:purine nucleoside permease
MKFPSQLGALALVFSSLTSPVLSTPVANSNAPQLERKGLWGNTDFVKRDVNSTTGAIKPKIMIISMFGPEADVWYGIPEFDVYGQNISLPGDSPVYPDGVHCTVDGDICQYTLGESGKFKVQCIAISENSLLISLLEINAASSVMALAFSPLFDFTTTYFMVAGIAGINPEVATIGSVTFARYAVQVALQYEFDIRELPSNFTTGYIPFGVDSPQDYPQTIYGTEVFELNTALQSMAVDFAKAASLNDSDAAVAYRANYATDEIYAAGAEAPAVYACDVATSDVYYSGRLLGEAFGNFTTLLTNGSGVYCSTAQEDNATLEVLTRAALAGLVDFARIIVMRTASDFDRQYPGEPALVNLLYSNQGGFEPAIMNIYLAGIKVVEGILDGWNDTFAAGVAAPNYIGDILGSLGGTPDFGPSFTVVGKRSLPEGNQALNRRALMKRNTERAGIKVRMPVSYM